MVLKISIKGFKLLRPVAKKTRCRVRVVRKKGLPFVLNKYKNRKTFIVGAVFFIILFYILSSFIWDIEVTGNKKLDAQLVIDKLASYGVKPGTLKYQVNTDVLVNNMMLDMKELAWVGVDLKGTTIKIEVVERVKPPELIPEDSPCNIVAYRDGVIKSVVAKIGHAEVKIGDTITKGQVLISGTITSENKSIPQKLVHAMGTVTARTWYERRCPVNLSIPEKVKTGEEKKHFSLVLFSKRINFFHGKIPYNNYDRIEAKKRLAIGENLKFPFEFIIDTFYEQKTVMRKLSLDKAKQYAADMAQTAVSSDIPPEARIVKTTTDYIQDEEGKITASVTVECIEDIGVKVGIGGN